MAPKPRGEIWVPSGETLLGLPPPARWSHPPPRPPAPPPARPNTNCSSSPFTVRRPEPACGSTVSQSPGGLTSVGSRPQRTAPWGSTHPGGRKEPEVGPNGARNELCNRQGPPPLPRPRSAALPPLVLGLQPIGHWGSRKSPPP